MNEPQLAELISESIALELNAAALYALFSSALPEDHSFWWQLHLEEKSHANLIRSANISFAKRGKFPIALVADSIEELKRANLIAVDMIDRFKANSPSRIDACEAALELECEAGETHFARYMERDATNPVDKVFQQLNRDDKEHKKRINEHLASLPVGA